jgi:alkaline phosphatase D
MGHPRLIKRGPQGTTRRTFFKRSGSAAAVAASAGLLASPLVARAAGPLFRHGVASGDPLSDRVVLWTRVTPDAGRSAVTVQYVIATDPQLTAVVQRGTSKTNPARDYTVKVDPQGLRPGTTYYYRFFADGEASPVGRTRTLPSGAADRLRFAVVSCSNHAYGYFNAYRRVAERADLDLVLHLGDYLYEYGPNAYGSVRTPEPPNEMVTLGDYRLRHAQYKTDADLQELHRQHPMVCIWDDHEITNDSWRDGAENHTPGAEGDWPQRVEQGLQAYYEWMPVRIVDPAARRNNARSFRFGDLAEILMLEERLGARSQQLRATVPVPGLGTGFVQARDFTDPGRQLLGASQEAWLAERLRTTTARWKLVGQGVMFAQLKVVPASNAAGGGVFLNTDQWDGYQPARDRVFAMLKADGQRPAVDNCVVLTGDIHSSWACDLTQDPNNAVAAAGGYNGVTGEGSVAVEFVGTSITSPGVNDPNGSTAAFLRSVNPHIKYVDLNRRGYMLMDVTRERAVAEYWYVDTVASLSNIQVFGTAFETAAGMNRIQPSAQTTPRANPPALAP